jgi:hypothetical protein
VLPRARIVAPALLIGLGALIGARIPAGGADRPAPTPVAARFAGLSAADSTQSSLPFADPAAGPDPAADPAASPDPAADPAAAPAATGSAPVADPATGTASGTGPGGSGSASGPSVSAQGLVQAPRKLSWSPPPLVAPITLAMGNSAATLVLNNARDYLLRLPAVGAAVRPAGLVISGGHNVVLIGGSVDVAGGVRTAGLQVQRRAMYLKGQTGTVFVEGVTFYSSATGTLTEGIDLDQRLGATVVLQNISLARLVGSRTTNHADGVQTWAGPNRLLIDGLSFQTQYQGMFLLPNQLFTGPAPVLFDLRNISIVGEPGSGYLLWRDRQAFPWRISNVSVRPGSLSLTARGLFLWDPLGTFATVRAAGIVPPAVTRSGTGYRSPGYAGRL